jgi:ankyrin repeat protein/TonB-like protein
LSAVLLTQAVTSGDAGAVKALLANGADVNERTGGGQTPLILATIFGHINLILLLLDAGADPQLRDNLGLNAVDWAQRRGATEVLDVLSNKPRQPAQTSTTVRTQTPPRSIPSTEPTAEKPGAVSEEERSRRWIAGLKQRIAEQSQREVPDGPNIFRPQVASPPEPMSQLASAEREPQPEIPAEPSKPQPEIPFTPPEPQPEIPAPAPDPKPELPAQPEPEQPTPTPGSPSETLEHEAQLAAANPSVDLTTSQTTPRRSGRKRCPKCNAIYNSDLVAYCAHHIVALVDDDDPPPIISGPQSTLTSPVLFWMIIIITLTGSIVVGSFVAAFFYGSKPAQPAVSASQPQTGPVQKGTPVVDKELEGKVVSLPIAECPLNGQEAIPGTVVVRVAVAKTGQVKEAQASGGDWLLRDAATKAAMKSTFAPDKLRGRDTEGTITYTFEP